MAESGSTLRRIVVLSDGTGNSAAKVWRTNVWRLYQALDLSNGRQVALYDDGVGSSSFVPIAVLGGALGFGLKRNVLDLYRFVCRNWTPDVEIFGFGFSRGAFTIRVLMGLIATQGLVPYQSEEQLRRDAAAAYRSYRKRYRGGWLVDALRGVRDGLLTLWTRMRGHAPYDEVPKRQLTSIAFVGLWDTVAAYGLPIEEMTRGFSMWLWPLSLPDRKLSHKVQRARHAVALDDARTTFHPVLWTEHGEKRVSNVRDERLSQVWFAGMHSNVGGGYPDDGLAHVSLVWMMEEAAAVGLEFKNGSAAIDEARLSSDQDGRLYDSRRGVGGYYRYGPRKLATLTHDTDHDVVVDLPKIHESVFERIRHGARAYAPVGLPARYAVVRRNGAIVEGAPNPYESTAKSQARALNQERVWDLVWRRRVVYFATLVPTFYLALFPWVHTGRDGWQASPWAFLAPVIRALNALVPAFASRWIDAFATNPGWFVLGAGLVSFFMWRGGRLGAQIVDEMRALWQTGATTANPPGGWIYRLRTNRVYVVFFHGLKRYVLPTAFAVIFLLGAMVILSRTAFMIASSWGLVCSTPRTVEPTFRTSALCAATGVTLEAGARYRITLTPEQRWDDNGIVPDGFEGFGREKMTWPMYLGLPLRRSLTEPWFRPLARIGATGNDVYVLRPAAASGTTTLVSEITARTAGPLFLYVNDTVIPLPWLADFFYTNNRGTAKVQVDRLQ